MARVASASIAQCSEEAISRIQNAIDNVKEVANAVIKDGEMLMNAMRKESQAFEAQIEAFQKLSQNMALAVTKAGNDVATFGGDR
jgi:hypothetical protein